MDISQFDFALPPELIAQHPPAERGASRLLVLDRATGHVTHTRFSELPAFLAATDTMVFNDTRVFRARLIGRRLPGGGAAECFLVRRMDGDLWEALVHPGQRLREGHRMVFTSADGAWTIDAEVVARHFHGRRVVRLTSTGGSIEDAIAAVGHLPLPPYIKRDDTALDAERYQTVYAARLGSIAAPTAGLHFTSDLLSSLDEKGIERVAVTLHVGYGTFQPVRVSAIEEHSVEPERAIVDETTAAALTRAARQRRRIVAVGTTTVRTLESLPRDDDGGFAPFDDETGLFIRPGHRFSTVGAMITNFHLPRSSLLMLVCAFGGREPVLAAYDEAVRAGYRFYSYGDAMLVC